MLYKRKTNWIVYLIFGIVITSLVTTVTFSRYMSNVSGSGVVSVASLDTDITTLSFVPTDLNKPGSTEIMRFNIVNYVDGQISEVDQNYSISINPSGNLPFTYELQCVNTESNGTGINTAKTAVNANTVISGGLLNHSVATSHEYELTITWPSNQNDLSYTEELELIKVVIDSQQIIG